MKANPGGQLASTEVIGRDKLIKRIWRSLNRQSVVLSAERRIGKTSIMLKMKAEVDPQEALAIFRDLEGIYTPQELVERVVQDIESYLSLKQKSAITFRNLLAHLAGTEVGGVVKLPQSVAPHWKDLLVRVVDDLMTQEERKVIFFWDEVPLMLHNIKRRASEAEAMEILDSMRALRQSHPKLRMIFTGSIGLHNVITGLRKEGYANDPTNDMDTIEVPPLEDEDAIELATLLLKGENLKVIKPAEVAQTIARAVDGFPFFIHHIIDEMARLEGDISIETVEQIVEKALTDAQDRWHMRWYRHRIDTYYGTEEKAVGLALLDALATTDAITFNDLFNLLNHKIPTEDAESVREILTQLGKDHYILQQPDGRYHFRFPLIKRSWRLQRGL